MSDLKDDSEEFVGETKHEYNFTWIIKNFTTLTGDIESKEFSLEPMCSTSWKVILKPLDKYEHNMSVGLKRSDSRVHSVSLDGIFNLRNSKGTLFVRRTLNSFYVYKGESIFSDLQFRRPSKSENVTQDLGSNFRLCSDDKLTVEGKIIIFNCCVDNEPMMGNIGDLQHDLSLPFRENLFTDVNFIIGNDSIPAHKFILVARSSVFKRMFENNMKENSDNTINITDIEKRVLETFLLFLYTGAIENYDEQIIPDLYSVADKYDVPSLLDTCRIKLLTGLSVENACQFLILAYIHNDEELQDGIFTYLCDNFIHVEQTKHWQKLAEHNPTLAAKVVCKFAKNMCKT